MSNGNIPNTTPNIIERRFIDNVLNEQLQSIKKDQDRAYNRFGFKSADIRSRRQFTVSNNTGTITHLVQHRFIDMKRINGKKQKSYPIHNRIILGHFGRLIFQLQYGLTQDVRNSIINDLNIEI